MNKLLVLCILSLSLLLCYSTVNAFEPLPDTALPLFSPDPAKGYAVVQYRNDIFFGTDGLYWFIGVVSCNNHGPKTLLVVDQPTGFLTNTSYINAVREMLNKSNAVTVSDILYSHHHKDHIGFAGALKAAFPRAIIHAHQKVYERLRDRNDPDRPVPNRRYNGDFQLPAFGIRAFDYGEAHSAGNIAVYHPQTKLLLYIDIVFPGWTTFKELAQAEFAPAFLEAHRRILELDFDVLVGGHVTRVGNRTDVEIQYEYMQDITTHSRYAMQTVDSTAVAQRLGIFDSTSTNFRNFWALLDTYIDEMATVCADRTLQKWSGKLGAVDVFTKGHCERVIESLRID